MLVGVSAAAGCMPEEEAPVRAPVAEEAPHRIEHVVVSKLVMVGSDVGNVGDHGTPSRDVATSASGIDRARPDPVFFHLGAGYGAIGQVDLTPCHGRGLDAGYVRLRVTFGGAGTVVRALVESPTQPPPEALACVAERVESASVPSFQGDDVTLSKSIFVAPAGQGPELFVNRDVTPNVVIAP
jgi:hypothetical protein